MTPSPAPAIVDVPAIVEASADAQAVLRLINPERACVETNVARKGLWQLGSQRGSADHQVLQVAGQDRIGPVERIDKAGPPLGVLELEMLVWISSRWREHGRPDSPRFPFTLQGLAADLGWQRGGHNWRELTKGLDALRMATFRTRIYDAGRKEMRLHTFGLLDEWEAGVPKQAGRENRAGFIALGGWLHKQLQHDYVTWIDWRELRALERPTARRLLTFLEAERFEGDVWEAPVDARLLGALGIWARRVDHARNTLRQAAAEVHTGANRYRRVSLERRSRGVWFLVAERLSH